jgi:xanthine dehydrogenase YagS FAD-binding subunit
MKPFEYQRLETPQDLASTDAGRFLGGGTNLIDLMKHQIETPDILVDVSRAGMDRIEEMDDAVRVGSQVSNTDLASHPLIRRHYPVLSSALLSGATQQLRNKATTGGNLLQRTRCQYFYDTARACNKRKPGSGCDALKGLNRFHAILGASEHCIAVHPSDMAVAMAALGAVVVTRKRDGSQTRIPVTKLHRLPGDRPDIDHVLDEGELIVAVELPAAPPTHQFYRKVRDRSSYRLCGGLGCGGARHAGRADDQSAHRAGGRRAQTMAGGQGRGLARRQGARTRSLQGGHATGNGGRSGLRGQ